MACVQDCHLLWGLTCFRCGSAFSGPAVREFGGVGGGGGLGRLESGRKAPKPSPVSTPSCFQVSPRPEVLTAMHASSVGIRSVSCHLPGVAGRYCPQHSLASHGT